MLSDSSVMPLSADFVDPLLGACAWPSEAFWRVFELSVLSGYQLEGPILELGCGDGAFTELAGLRIDEAIDLNPRAVARARRRHNVYVNVRCGDVRELAREAPGKFGTVFANSVLEHVGGLPQVLSACVDILRPGGALVTTVPLADMNQNLTLSAGWYVRLRQRQLCHQNLWSLDQWQSELLSVGFQDVATSRYLDPDSCRFWDALDLPAGWGVGRYRLATVARPLSGVLLPKRVRNAGKRWLGRKLAARLESASAAADLGCAALIIARKSNVHLTALEDV